jgi:hypothetical protein
VVFETRVKTSNKKAEIYKGRQHHSCAFHRVFRLFCSFVGKGAEGVEVSPSDWKVFPFFAEERYAQPSRLKRLLLQLDHDVAFLLPFRCGRRDHFLPGKCIWRLDLLCTFIQQLGFKRTGPDISICRVVQGLHEVRAYFVLALSRVLMTGNSTRHNPAGLRLSPGETDVDLRTRHIRHKLSLVSAGIDTFFRLQRVADQEVRKKSRTLINLGRFER